MSDEQYRQELREYFAHVPFWQHTGCVIEELKEDSAVLSLEVQAHHLNGNRTVHGGVYATLLDNAMGLASRAKAGRHQATTNLNIHYVAAVDKGKLRATGRVVHRTRRTVTTAGRVETEDGTLLALATATFRVFPEK